MQKPSRITLLLSLSAFAILAMLAAACTPVGLSGAAGGSGCSQENGDGDNDFCALIEGNPNSGSWSVPGSEYTITSFVIKAGTDTFGAVAGCYEVSQSGSSVSWNRVGDGPDCKDISHVEIYYTYNPPPPPPPQNVQYCRATGDPYPYEVATAQLDATTNQPVGFGAQDIYPVPTGGCPQPPPPPQDVQYCKATGNPYPYTVATAQLDATTNKPVGFGAQDIYPVPAEGCPTEPPPPPPPQNVQYCRATGNPFPYEVTTAQLDTTTNLPLGFDSSKDMYPIPTGGCPQPPPPQQITLCHATGSATNPYVELTINYNGLHGHEDHEDDIIPVPTGGCPTPQTITICHATGSATNPYVQLTIKYMGQHGHEGHADDIIPMPAGGCPPPPPQRITLCHATGSATNPYVELSIDYNGLHGHEGHTNDIIPVPAGGCPLPPVQVSICHATGNPYPYEVVTVSVTPGGLTGHENHPLDISPVPAGGCPQPPPPPPVQFCQATGNPYPYQLATAQLDPNTNKPVGFNAAKDVYPVPLGGCPQEPPPPPPPPEYVTICHATGNPYPYVEMRVVKDADTGLPVGHEGHSQDIVPMPDGGCPTEPPPNDDTVIIICHATGDPYPYTRLRIVYDPLVGHGHEGHTDDIIPAPRDGCPTEPPPPQITICHAAGSPYPYVETTVDQDPVTGEPIGHEGHTDDIVPMPADGCPQEPPSQTINICHATGDPYPYVLVTATVDLATGLHGHEGDANDIIPAPVDGCPTDDEPPVIPPAPPPVANCPQFIIFHTFRDENLEIYRLDGVEGDPDAELINLTNSDAVDCRPSRSPDDTWVVYQSDRNENVELYYTDLGGSSQIRLTTSDSNNINPIFGPDNRTVAFQSDRNGNWDIFTTDLLTQGLRQLTSSVYDEVNPFWSPDLRWLAFQTNRNGNWDIYILDTQTGNEYALATGAGDQIYPAWSPNGQQVAYLSDVNGVWNLYVIDYTGENLLQITDGNGDTTNATWSPEGYRIAYQSERGGNVDVYSYDLRTESEYRLTSYAGSDSGPTWDCGGTNIAFTSTRDGNPNVLQVFWQGGAQSNLTLDPATDKWSQWSPSKEPASRGR